MGVNRLLKWDKSCQIPLSLLLVLLPHPLDSPHQIPDTMLPNTLFLALLWAATHTLLVSGRSSFLRTRSLSGASEYDTWKAMRRAFAGSGLQQRDTTEKSIPLDKSWEDATLLAFTGCAHSFPFLPFTHQTLTTILFI